LLSTFRDVTDLKERQMDAERRADSLGRENKVLRSSLRERYRLGDILGRCESMQTVYETILKAAATDASVAIYGESGTGKELACAGDPRQQRPQIPTLLGGGFIHDADSQQGIGQVLHCPGSRGPTGGPPAAHHP
jgi:hypothetical protein